MIVKNEEHVIERCLMSALPLVSSWCIVDTGSTDSTMTKIREITERFGKPGTLHERPWVNFGHNRSEALELARSSPWSLMMDADDILHSSGTLSLAEVTTYYIQIRRGNLSYERPILFNNKYEWKYIGAVHEYAKLSGPEPTDVPLRRTLPAEFWLDARCEGARSKNPKKYEEDAIALEEELKIEPTNERAMFYAAQSWRDARVYDKAYFWYEKRLAAGGWFQERYISLLNLARITSDLEKKFHYAWKSIELCQRLEVVHHLLKYTRERDLWSVQAYSLGTIAKNFPRQSDGLFVEQSIYDYEFDDEFSIHCYYRMKYEESSAAATSALKKAPPAHQERIRANNEFAIKRLN